MNLSNPIIPSLVFGLLFLTILPPLVNKMTIGVDANLFEIFQAELKAGEALEDHELKKAVLELREGKKKTNIAVSPEPQKTKSEEKPVVGQFYRREYKPQTTQDVKPQIRQVQKPDLETRKWSYPKDEVSKLREFSTSVQTEVVIAKVVERLSEEPTNGYLWALLGEKIAEKGDYEEAIKNYQQARDIFKLTNNKKELARVQAEITRLQSSLWDLEFYEGLEPHAN